MVEDSEGVSVLRAVQVYAGVPDGDVFMLAFTEDPEDAEAPSLMIQAGDHGMSEGAHYCFVLENQACHYGGLVDWSCDAGVLSLMISPEAAQGLELDERVEITFEKEHTKTVLAAMRAIFEV